MLSGGGPHPHPLRGSNEPFAQRKPLNYVGLSIFDDRKALPPAINQADGPCKSLGCDVRVRIVSGHQAAPPRKVPLAPHRGINWNASDRGVVGMAAMAT